MKNLLLTIFAVTAGGSGFLAFTMNTNPLVVFIAALSLLAGFSLGAAFLIALRDG